ncbi:MAG: phosphate acyltransferase PlsX [Phycisphaerae bacterium]|nr:phosphate acyltransferase PlsX [Phycisphaerae bacterium]MCZ2401520.1 phosphate acyltransferase PlsX [Phycisphaerae bacterium]NUQ50185.1 phosphate acyltransferase PlsX [Phycisphaerae bacterium]
MRIALDAMGGDHAPREIVRGAAAGLRHLSDGDQMLLYGLRDVIEGECREHGLTDPRIRIEHCSQTIGMDESPVEALRGKRDSTIVRMASAAGKGELDAIISAGNTGAFAAAAQLRIKPIAGVTRPGIAVVMPTFRGPVILCDVGANTTPKPHHLHEYARMCDIYAREILGIAEPQVGIISIGEEEAKGNPLVKEAHALLKGDPQLHFIGNVEGRDIFAGEGQVFICDGFVGNVTLKLTEGLAEGLFKTIVREIGQEGPSFAQQFAPIVERIWKRHDFAEYGGAPLLGIKSVVIICHGRSDQRAISNAIRVAAEQIRTKLNSIIESRMATLVERPA